MSLKNCIEKLSGALSDFDTDEIVQNAEEYQARGLESKAAEIKAVQDHIAQLKAEQERIAGEVVAAHAKSMPASPAGDSVPAVITEALAETDAIEAKITAVDAAAHQAAPSKKNDLPAPTEAQIEAGNYKKGHVRIGGLDITIGNPAGSRRRPEWPVLKSHYGYVKRTEGADGEHIDVFLKEGVPTDYDGPVFVIDQPKANGHFDEHKVMIGWNTEVSARGGYLRNYTRGWKVGPITQMSMAEFKDWLDSGDTTARASDAVESPKGDYKTGPQRAAEAKAEGKNKDEKPESARARRVREYSLKDYDSMPKAIRKVVDRVIDNVDNPKQLRRNLRKMKGTPWSIQALDGMLARAALEDAAAGLDPQHMSALDSNPRLQDALMGAGTEAVFRYLDSADHGFIGSPSKPELAVNSSFSSCDPSIGCATFCYATGGNYLYEPNILKGELVNYAVGLDAQRSAAIASRQYLTLDGTKAGKALRLFDKGDGSRAWLPFIKAMNEAGIRTHIFSKQPEFLRAVPDMNVRLFSVDSTNTQKAYDNPDLPVAYVFTTAEDVKHVVAMKDSLQLVLPVQGKGMEAGGRAWREIPPAIRNGKICPIDGSVEKIFFKEKIGNTVVKKPWNCTHCDLRGDGIGCYNGQTTKDVLARVELLRKSPQDIAMPAAIKELQDFIDNERRLTPEQKLDFGRRLAALTADLRAGIDPGAEAAERGTILGTTKDSEGVERLSGRSSEEGAGEESSAVQGRVESPRNKYGISDAQLDLFPAAEREAHRESRVALEELLRRNQGTVFGNAIARDFEARGYSDLVGKKIRTPRDLALAAQIYRDPRFETLRYIFTDADKNIVYQTGVTSRMPGMATLAPSGWAIDDWLSKLVKDAQSIGAVKIWMLHNHPSGNATPSEMDMGATRRVARLAKDAGMPFGHHVVIDTDQYAQFTEKDADDVLDSMKPTEDFVRQAKLGKLAYDVNKAAVPHALLGSVITSPRHVADIAKRVSELKSQIVLIGVGGSDKGVTYLGEIAPEHLIGPRGGAIIHRIMLKSASIDMFAANVPRHLAARAAAAVDEGFLRDAIIQDGAEGMSVHSMGLTSYDRRDIKKPSKAVKEDQADYYPDADNNGVTSTPAFKRWFGKSKVVDADGEPLVVYHGTGSLEDTDDAITNFEGRDHWSRSDHPRWLTSAGDWFTADPKVAEHFANMRENGHIYPAYLSIKNPARFRTYEDAEGDQQESGLSVQKWVASLENAGYDGLIIDRSDTDTGTVRQDFVPFNATQVKSATGNRGTFDGSNPDIRFAARDTHAWDEVVDTAAGPVYSNHDITLFPGGVEGAGLWENEAVYSAIDTDTGARLGNVVVGLKDGQIDTLYWIESHQAGAGTRIMQAIVANSTGPVTIDNIMDTAKPFWDKVGIYDYDGRNAKLDWKSFEATGRSTQGVSRGLQASADAADSSRSGRNSEKGLTEKGLHAYLASKLGARGVRNLLDSGKFKIVSSTDERLPADARSAAAAGRRVYGYFDESTGTTYLIHDNLTDAGQRTGMLEDGYAIFLHEVGVHFGMPQMLGDMFDTVVNEVAAAAESGRGELGRAAAAARALVPQKTNPKHVNEETLAWLVTDRANHKLSLVKRIIAKIRAFLVRKGFKSAISPDALVELARGAAMRAAGNRVNGASGFARNNDVFYSKALQAIESAPMAKGTGEQWLAMMSKAGTKQEEIDWLGLRELLDGKTGVTRDELAAHVRANQVVVTEVVKDDATEPGDDEDQRQRRQDELEAMGEDDFRLLVTDYLGLDVDDDYIADNTDDLIESIMYEEGMSDASRVGRRDPEREAQYSKYQTPGGSDYRELVLTLPHKGGSVTENTIYDMNRKLRAGGYDELSFEQESALIRGNREAYDILDDLESRVGISVAGARDDLMGGNPENALYHSEHWQEANPIAHIRFNERTDADGKRVLFVEEIQSDWHQEGRKHGYFNPAKRWEVFNIKTADVVARFSSEKEAMDEQEKLGGDYDWNLNQGDGAVANAPFKQSWPILAMKRVIRWAAENGFDRVAWTTGDMQAERYNLSHQVDKISFFKPWNKAGIFVPDGSVGLDFSLGRSAESRQMTVKDSDLEQHVGKELAEKIRSAGAHGTVSGDGLRMGGEGMKGFYDKILPNETNKYIKKWGGKVERIAVDISNGRPMSETDWNDWGSKKVHGFDITPAMRDAVMQGQPLFAQRDAMFSKREADGYGRDHSTEQPAGNGVTLVVTRIPSGMTRPGDLATALDTADAVGIDISTVSEKQMGALPQEVAAAAKKNNALRVFVDSGEFSAFQARMRGQSSAVNFERVLDRYRALFDAVEGQRDPYMFVMPDVVGDQRATLNLIGTHLDAIEGMASEGADLIFPYQAGEMGMAEYHDALVDLLPENIPTWRIGIPSNKAAMDSRALGELLSHIPSWNKWHILGAVRGPKFDTVIRGFRALLDPRGEYDISADANQMRAEIGTGDRSEIRGRVVDRSTQTVERTTPDLFADSTGRFAARDPGGLDQKARDWLGDHLTTKKKVNFWSRSVGTMYHLSEKVPEFKPVFDAGQRYLSDTSRIAVQAEGLAPDLFRQMTSVGTALKTGAAKTKDIEAAAKAVYEGTLNAQKIYTDAELRSQFNLNKKQIGLYRQAMRAAHKSLDDLTKSTLHRIMGIMGVPRGMLDAARESQPDAKAFLQSVYDEELKPLRDNLAEQVEEIKADLDDIKRAESLNQGDDEALAAIREQMKGAEDELASATKELDSIKESIAELYKTLARAKQLKDEGYFPLMRFGKYSVDVTETDGMTGESTRHYFGTFESEADANKMARLMQEEYPQAEVSTGILDDSSWRLYPGLSPEVVESFARMTGTSGAELFQEYLKTAVNNRSAMKRLIHRKGVPGFSGDINRTLATFIMSNARLASSHYHMGDLRKAVEDIPKGMGDVKEQAVKLAIYLTNPTEEFSGLRNFMFFNFLGGSMASALTNLTQVPLATFPYLSRHKGAVAALLKWANPTAKPSTDAHKAALLRAEEEGIVSPQEVHNLMATARGGTLGAGKVMGARPVQTALYIWGSMFSAAEQYNRRTTFNAAYDVAVKNNMPNPYDFAVKAVEETQFVYNRGNRPNWARGIGAPLFTFKQFSVNYLELIARMPRKQKLLMIALLVLAAGVEGLPFEEDLEDVIDTIAQWNGYAWSTRKELEAWADKHLGVLAPVLMRGVSGTGIPIDVQARLGLGNLLPGTGVAKPSSLDSTREAMEVLGVPGSLLRTAGMAAKSAAQGQWADAAFTMAPSAVKNAQKGIEMWQEGAYLDAQKRMVTTVGKVEAGFKFIGFQSANVGDIQETQNQVRGIVQLHKLTEDGIADKWARGLVFNKPELVEEARQAQKDWNRKNPEAQIQIKPRQIKDRTKALRTSQTDRFLKQVPTEIRGNVSKVLN
jgi:hypothetical protein